MQPTPGPWVRSWTSDIRGADNFLVGMVNPIGSFKEISEANARLIAAAPDMLAALRDAESCFDAMAEEGYLNGHRRNVWAAMRAAIARAESGQ